MTRTLTPIWLILILWTPLSGRSATSDERPVLRGSSEQDVVIWREGPGLEASGPLPCLECAAPARCSCCGRINDHARAGHAHQVSRHAIPSVTCRYSVGYVGGGAPVFGQPRFAFEGTFGLDYSGLFTAKRIWLNWWHGRHEQGGRGSYETDGPHLLRHR